MPNNIVSLNVRTIYGARLQNSQHIGTDFNLMPNSTLNQKFDILHNSALNGSIPRMRYICAGSGAGKHITMANGDEVLGLLQHSVRDAALYTHRPWVLRPLNNDLDAVNREKFSLRKILNLGSVDYVAYYLKKLDFSNISSEAYFNTPNSNPTVFTPIPGDLSPIKPNILPTGVTPTTGNYLNTSTIVRFTMDAWDLNEYLNAWEIMQGSTAGCCITELGLCSGVDKVTTGIGFGGTTFNYTETIAVQINHHLTLDESITGTGTLIELELDLGSTEPLFLT